MANGSARPPRYQFHFEHESLYEEITIESDYIKLRIPGDKPPKDRVSIKRLRLVPECPYSKIELEGFRTMQQPSEEWLRARVDFLTSSRFGEITNEQPSAFSSALQYWREVTGRVDAKPFGPQQQEHVEHGRKYEPVARGLYERLNHVQVIEEGLRVIDEAPWIYSASSDGLIDNDPCNKGIIEIKCNNVGIPRNYVPEYYIPQIMGAMAVYKTPFCDFINYWAHDNKYHERFFFCARVYFNELYWQRLKMRLDYMAWCIAYDKAPTGMLDLKRDYPLPPIVSHPRRYVLSDPKEDDVNLKLTEESGTS